MHMAAGSKRPKKGALSVRSVLQFWHRWFGLLAAVWILALSLTGSAIVFYDELESWLNPEIWHAEGSGEPLPPGVLVEAAQAHAPGAYVRLINLPDAKSRISSAVALMAPRTGEPAPPPGGLQIYLNPYTGEVLGTREPHVVSLDRRHIMGFIYELHIDLMAGGAMVWFLGLVAALWIVDHFLSTFYTFQIVRNWVNAFRVRFRGSANRQVFDWHRALGVWLLPVTLMLAVSGVYFNWYGVFTGVVERFSPLTAPPTAQLERLDEPAYPTAASIATAIEAARTVTPAQIDIISAYPTLGVYRLRVFDPRDMDPYGRRSLTIDMQSGEIIGDFHPASGSAGDVFVAWQYPLHSGSALGLPGRIVIFLAGIGASVVTGTGIVLWINRTLARRRVRKARA